MTYRSPLDSATVIVGKDPLSVRLVADVARRRRKIEVDAHALGRVSQAHNALIAAAEAGLPVYGVTHGVGQNVDRRLLTGENVFRWDSVRAESMDANRRLLNTHSAGIGAPLSADEVRASLLIRAHGLLQGRTGCRPEIVRYLTGLLENDTLPEVRGIGSVGQADVGLSGAMGFGECVQPYRTFPPTTQDGLHLEGRDALSLVSTNAVSVGQACLILHDYRKLLKGAEAAFLASLNGLDGHAEPLCSAALQYQSPQLSQRRRTYYSSALRGSRITRAEAGRKIQDPLSFRCSPLVFEAAERALQRCEHSANEFLNSTEDNPMVIVNDTSPLASELADGDSDRNGSAAQVLPTANFCPLLLAMELNSLASLLGHVGFLSVQRTLRLSEPQHTGLTRFLGVDQAAFGFCALQKIPVALAAELRKESHPSFLDLASMADGMEDFSTHLPLLVKSLKSQWSILLQLASVELLHACQAMSLRLAKDPSLSFGVLGDSVLRRVRDVIPMYKDDRQITPDVDAIGGIVLELSGLQKHSRREDDQLAVPTYSRKSV